MAYVSMLGWNVLALSLASDHLDFLGWPGDGPFWPQRLFFYYLEPDLKHIVGVF